MRTIVKSKKLYSILNLAFKIIIALLSISYLVYVVLYQKREYTVEGSNQTIDLNIQYLWQFVKNQFQQSSTNYIFLGSAILLIFANWGAEVVKWKIMISKMFPVNYKLATISILSGIAASVFTPYRIGGYFGRIAHLPFRYRAKGIALILLGDVAQFLTTIFFGSLALMLLLLQSPSGFEISDQKTLLIPISLVVFMGSLLSIFVFINMQKFIFLLEKINFLKGWKKLWGLFEKMNHQEAAKKVLLISIMRYAVLLMQYFLIFELFGFKLSLYDSVLLISALFFIYHFLPTFNIVEFGITKSAIVLFLIQTFIVEGPISLNVTLIVSCSSFLIWLINLVIPSLLGSFYLLRIKLLNDKL